MDRHRFCRRPSDENSDIHGAREQPFDRGARAVLVPICAYASIDLSLVRVFACQLKLSVLSENLSRSGKAHQTTAHVPPASGCCVSRQVVTHDRPVRGFTLP